tara:strand:+ start:676 stop:1098 length:423 start_codon:yes stop_codon:yes gene_type:complete
LIFTLFFDIIISMGQKKYSFIMVLTTILAWLGFFIVINNFDPFQANILIFIFFYSTLFLSIFGTFLLLLFQIRKMYNKKRNRERIIISESLQQAVLISLVFIIALILQASRILTWWNTILLIIVASMFEFVILVFKTKKV